MSQKPKPVQPKATHTLEHERLTSLINSMADGVLATDEHGKVAVYNGAALNLLDLNSSLIGQNIADVCVLIDSKDQPVDVKALVTGKRTQHTTRDLRLRYPDGNTINLYISVAPVRHGYGAAGTRGFVMLLRDITREKSLEQERDEFISVVSHELRTPIAIAEGNVGNAEFIVEKHGAMREVREALAEAHAQIMFLSAMINDLATLSRAERGVLSFEIEPINAHDVVVELQAAYQKQAKAKQLVINTDIDEHLEAFQSSHLYVREILQNFVTNAIKYTQTGSITIGAHSQKSGVTFTVSDTGIGISKGDQQRVFNKFFRSEDYRTRESTGTGLGLYITAKLARLIKAKISVESQLNKGSTFSIFFPNLAT